MEKIFVKFFGTPEIWVDDKKINLIHKKAEAMFFYLVVRQQSTRDELVSLLWGDFDEKNGKRSLRNSLYQLKQLLGPDVLSTKGNTFILVNDDLNIETDLSILLADDVKSIIGLKEYVFMHNFNVRNCEGYDDWQSNMRNTFTSIFLEKFEAGMNKAVVLNNVKMIEYFANSIIDIDIFNEKAFQALMNLYADKGAYNEAIKIYYTLKNSLEKELLIEPNKQTLELYEKIVELKRNSKMNYLKANEQILYGRIKELLIIKGEYQNFILGNEYRSIVLKGETGIGKTRLIEEFSSEIKTDESNIYCFTFTTLTKNTPFGAVLKILDRLAEDSVVATIKKVINTINNSDDISLDKLNGLISSYFNLALSKRMIDLTKTKRLVIIFDNICNIDIKSFYLLMNIIEQQNGKKIFFILSSDCSNSDYVDSIISELVKNHIVKTIVLNRFSREEVGAYAGLSVKHIENKLSMIDDIYNSTKGNPFLLTNILNNLKQNDEYESLTESNIIFLDRIVSSFERNEKIIMETIAVFPRGIEFNLLVRILKMDSDGLIEIVENLKSRSLLKERNTKKGEILLEISLELLRRYLYEKISNIKKINLHIQVAGEFEHMHSLNKDSAAYLLELKYHYSNTNNVYKCTLFKTKYLERRLNYCDEFFPTIKKFSDDKVNLFIENEKIYKEFEEIQALIETLQNENREGIEEIQLIFTFIYGRKLIRDGNYEQGIASIMDSIRLSEKNGNDYYNIHGHLELIYHGIKTNSTMLMKKNIELLKSLEFIVNYDAEKGILFRLKGLLNLMDGNYKHAEALLRQSILVFTKHVYLQNNNFLNIAAAYSYIGDIRGLQGKFDEALDYHKKAIEICKRYNTFKGLDLFYNKSGQILYLKDEYELAKEYFIKAFDIYDILGTFWDRSVAESYMAIICYKNNQIIECNEHLNRAEIYAKKNSSPYEMKILNEAKRIIRSSGVNLLKKI